MTVGLAIFGILGFAALVLIWTIIYNVFGE